MMDTNSGKVAILYPGDYEVRRNATPENNRLASIFKSLTDLCVHAEPAVYHDEFCDEVRRQLMRVDGVLVWMNPIQDGRDRSILDAMLYDIADDNPGGTRCPLPRSITITYGALYLCDQPPSIATTSRPYCWAIWMAPASWLDFRVKGPLTIFIL
jgi:hypothetical protein